MLHRLTQGVPWPKGNARIAAVAIARVADLTRDQRLRERLAVAWETGAARRWAKSTEGEPSGLACRSGSAL